MKVEKKMDDTVRDAHIKQPADALGGEGLRRLLEEERDLERQRMTLALRDTYTEIYELDLAADTSVLLFSSSTALPPVCGAEPAPNADIIAESVHPADRERIGAVLNGPRLRELFASGINEVSEEFRRLGMRGDKEKDGWVSSLAVPLPHTGAQSTTTGKALLFIKDISERKTQEGQRRTLEQYGLALRSIYDIFFEINVTQNTYRRVHFAKDKFVLPPESGLIRQLLTENARHALHPTDKRRFLAFLNAEAMRKDFRQGRKLRMAEFRILQTDGTYHWVSFTAFPLSLGEHEDECYLVFGVDIHARKMAEEIASKNVLLQQRRLMDERYRIVVEQTSTMLFEWRDSVHYIAPELMQRFAGNYDSRDILDVWTEDQVAHPEDLPLLFTFQAERGKQPRQEMTIRLLQRSGAHRWCRVTVAEITEHGGIGRHCLGTVNDVDEATRAALSLRKQAEQDMLTGVYNMRTFFRVAERRIRENPDRRFHVIRMDVDGFKVINDLYGLDEGDRLLKSLAHALQSRMTGLSECGRIGADVFCACVDFDHAGIERLVREIGESMARYPLPSMVLPSFGICPVDTVDTSISVLCDWANLALKTVKGNAMVLFAYYDETLRQTFLTEKRIESEMRDALARGEFKLYFQPKVHIESGCMVGAEGLVRWEHPERGILAPDEFIPIFEKNGFIIPLDEYMWEEACKALRQWIDSGETVVPLSVNVSRMHVHDTRLCEKLESLVERYRIPVELLELELTESVFLENKPQTFSSIRRLSEQGFRFSLDDFGAGYSSLNILKSLPVETLKLDRAFLDEVVNTDRGKAIVRGIIALAKSIDLNVLAEGVQSFEQALFLQQSACPLAQGFYYSRPVPREEFDAMRMSTNPLAPGIA